MVKFLFYFLLLIFPLGQLTRLPLNRGEINIYLHDLVIVLILLFWWLKKKIKKEKISWPKLTQPILAFFITALFGLILTLPYFKTQEILIASLYLFRWIAYSSIYFVLYDYQKNNKIIINNQLLIISGVMAVILGLLQYFFLPDIRPLTQFGWDPHYYRIVGAYLDPGYTGLIYALTLILLVLKVWDCQKKKSKKIALTIVGFVVYLALALTYARSAYLAYLAAMTVIACYKKSVKFFFSFLVLGVITIFLLPRPGGEGVKLERQSTIWARINNYQQTIKITLKKPVFGWGFNTYRYTQRKLGILNNDNWQETHSGAGADSSLLFIFATTGVVGFMSYLWLLLRILKKKSVIVFATTIAILIHSFFNNSLFYGWIMIWWWLVLGIMEYKKG